MRQLEEYTNQVNHKAMKTKRHENKSTLTVRLYFIVRAQIADRIFEIVRFH